MKTIALTNSNKRVRVSNEDYAVLSRYSWYAKRSRDQDYPCTGIRTGDKVKTIRMHRFVVERMGILTDENPFHEVHHINENRFDCTRENLAALSPQEHGLVTRGVYADDVPF